MLFAKRFVILAALVCLAPAVSQAQQRCNCNGNCQANSSGAQAATATVTMERWGWIPFFGRYHKTVQRQVK